MCLGWCCEHGFVVSSSATTAAGIGVCWRALFAVPMSVRAECGFVDVVDHRPMRGGRWMRTSSARRWPVREVTSGAQLEGSGRSSVIGVDTAVRETSCRAAGEPGTSATRCRASFGAARQIRVTLPAQWFVLGGSRSRLAGAALRSNGAVYGVPKKGGGHEGGD